MRPAAPGNALHPGLGVLGVLAVQLLRASMAFGDREIPSWRRLSLEGKHLRSYVIGGNDKDLPLNSAFFMSAEANMLLESTGDPFDSLRSLRMTERRIRRPSLLRKGNVVSVYPGICEMNHIFNPPQTANMNEWDR